MKSMSGEIKELLAAMVKLQAADPRPKNTETAKMRQYSYNYSPLSEIIASVRPLMRDYGLGFCQQAVIDDDFKSVSISTMIFHESGQFIEFEPVKIIIDYENKSVNPAQAAGIAMTYGRRYSLTAALGISSEDDTDGKAPGELNNKRPESPPAKKPASKGSKSDQARLRAIRLKALQKLVQESGYVLDEDDKTFIGQEINAIGKESLETLTEEEFMGVLSLLEQRIKASNISPGPNKKGA